MDELVRVVWASRILVCSLARLQGTVRGYWRLGAAAALRGRQPFGGCLEGILSDAPRQFIACRQQRASRDLELRGGSQRLRNCIVH